MRGPSPRMTKEKAMPMIDADGCLLNVSVEGRDGGPALLLSNSLASAMRMGRPWTIERAARTLFAGAFRPRRAGDPRRPQHRQDPLVRPVDGRHGRAM